MKAVCSEKIGIEDGACYTDIAEYNAWVKSLAFFTTRSGRLFTIVNSPAYPRLRDVSD